jgi:micrococcal nuclease
VKGVDVRVTRREPVRPRRRATGTGSLVLAVVLLSAAACAPPVAAQSPTHQAIRDEVARFVAAVNRGDATELAALYTSDPTVSTFGDGQIHRGRRAVVEVLRSAVPPDVRVWMRVDSLEVVELGPGAALATLRYRWGSDAWPAQAGAMTIVYVRTAAGWRVVHDHTSTLPDAPAAPPDGEPAADDRGPLAPVRPTTPCVVTRIVDGDTLECDPGARVRLIGIDTPERSQPPFGGQATAALARLAPVGGTVELELDVEPRDRYGRLLAYVWVADTLVNWRLVRDGWALLLTYPPNVQYVEWFTRAQQRAREEQRGLWSSGGFDCPPVEHRRRRC